MYKEKTFQPIKINNPIIDDFIKISDAMNVNGGTIVSCFKVNDHSVFKNLPWLEHEKYNNYIQDMLTSPDIIKNIPELNIPKSIEVPIELENINSLILDGAFAIRLIKGGAYKDFKGTPMEAKKLGSQLCEQIFQNRFLGIKIFYSQKPWTNWFYDVNWDSTWVIFDEQESMVWIICMTDTD
ncbi:hypothetical protein COF37_08505 [Bacillus wiedmannii]|uniref:hypothetical protein n=1 Tax=Bacillus wiedmannii TaxID=1890302 RepID=UPI000BFD97DC|nr:hypothetical protein [Bacillus wiedmannii]PHA04398.1 hypothetical protein COE63_05285 [Bacillus wiedmannii]PHD26356.1 hypothetical protein COF37_08505 [Bacillus wiedmannii]